MYPAMARHWRNAGVQVACQFQYDARRLAGMNWDWPQHYLNLWHVPGKGHLAAFGEVVPQFEGIGASLVDHHQRVAGRRPDPVLQQVEDFEDGTVTANDCLRPVSRYFDRITRPEQIVPAFERAMQVLTDAADCGPATLAFCQDVQTEAFDFPVSFFAEQMAYGSLSMRSVRVG